MATNNTFSVKNGLTIGNTTVIAANGVWVGAATNLIGPQGVQGVQGSAGAQGTVGAQGTIGAQGDVGAQGAIGAQGSAGAQGFVGAQGATGPQGVQGFNGTQGAQGDVGAQGPTGPTGPQGPTGAPGAQGVQGQTGSPGAQGVQGSAGPTDAVAKAWVAFNGVTTPTVRSSYNVSSVSRYSTGQYLVSFTTAMTDVNYCFLCNAQDQNNGMGIPIAQADPTRTIAVGSLPVIYNYPPDTAYYDAQIFTVTVFR